MAAGAWLRGATWGAGTWLRGAAWGAGTAVRLARVAANPRTASALARELGESVRGRARDALGVNDLDARLRRLTPGASAAVGAERDGISPDTGALRARGTKETTSGLQPHVYEALRARGAELLRRSADVETQDDGHPAYARILDELAPDEARIVRLLYTDGPQPSVDVRTLALVGLGSQLVAEGLTMIGQQAGCRHLERIPAYLNNLHRLGLIWFSKEPIEDTTAYQVLEAQPDVLAAIKKAHRARTVHRSIRLTPFGRDFCEAALPVDTGAAQAPASGSSP